MTNDNQFNILIYW